MKLPSFQAKKSAYVPQRPKRDLDVSASRKPFFSTISLRSKHSGAEYAATIGKSRSFDGVQKEKQPFIVQLKKCSLQDLLWRFYRKGEIYCRFAKRLIVRLTPDIAPHKMLYGSLIGGVAFGIISMGFIEHYFGPGVFAARSLDSGQSATVLTAETAPAAVVDSGDTKPIDYNSETDIFAEYFSEVPDAQYKESVQNMVKGYPIEDMLPYIFEQDRMTSAFLIGIAKKESNWGKRVPVLDGQDCFNYWGYRGIRRLMGTGGHTCFNSSKDAVETVAKRLNTLIYSEELNTPEKMIVWKCGFSCSGHSRESVKKWISDVDMYFKQLKEQDE